MKEYAIFRYETNGKFVSSIGRIIDELDIRAINEGGTIKIVSGKGKVSTVSYNPEQFLRMDALNDFIKSGHYRTMFPDIQICEVKRL